MKRKDGMPEFVYLSLLGINSRAAALCYAIGSILIALGCGIYGFREPVYFYGLSMFGAAASYLYAIWWVDKHADWD